MSFCTMQSCTFRTEFSFGTVRQVLGQVFAGQEPDTLIPRPVQNIREKGPVSTACLHKRLISQHSGNPG